MVYIPLAYHFYKVHIKCKIREYKIDPDLADWTSSSAQRVAIFYNHNMIYNMHNIYKIFTIRNYYGLLTTY